MSPIYVRSEIEHASCLLEVVKQQHYSHVTMSLTWVRSEIELARRLFEVVKQQFYSHDTHVSNLGKKRD